MNIDHFLHSSKTIIKKFWSQYESKIVLAIGFILIAGLSFEIGFLKNHELKQNPLIIEKPTENQVINSSSKNTPKAQKSAQDTKKSPSSPVVSNQTCIYVGSKNSNKYHLPTSSYAKRIKPENLVCFSSQEEAKSRGYTPDKHCAKQ